MEAGEGSRFANQRVGEIMKNRKHMRNLFLATLGIGGAAWFLYTKEPFASKMEPYQYRGTRLPTTPSKEDGHDGPTTSVSPPSSPHTGSAAGNVEGRKLRA